jgi:hypothetical protein
MMRLTALSLLLLGFGFPSSQANAAQTAPLFKLASQYRAAVNDFEKVLLKVRGIDRNDERLVDRLDDETARLRLAARNPRHLNKMYHKWRQVQQLHAQVQSTIFGKYTPNHELVEQWESVSYFYSLFAEEFFFEVENPRHGNTVRRFQSSSARRNAYSPPPTR